MGIPAEQREGMNALFGVDRTKTVSKNPKMSEEKPKPKVPCMSDLDMEILKEFGREVCTDSKTGLVMYEPLKKLEGLQLRMYNEVLERYNKNFMS
ncbi:hypothetical protein ACFLZ7_03805 [Nanoarchaeota archaeon]